MKKIFTLSLITALAAVIFTGCVKRYGDVNESYWLSRERAEVVYSDSYCDYYVVESVNGYAILRTFGGSRPYEGAVLYGNFSNYGARDFYNRSSGYVFTAEVMEYWLTYYEALDAIDYYCPLGKAKVFKSTQGSENTK